jgi:hypothetical protein
VCVSSMLSFLIDPVISRLPDGDGSAIVVVAAS